MIPQYPLSALLPPELNAGETSKYAIASLAREMAESPITSLDPIHVRTIWGLIQAALKEDQRDLYFRVRSLPDPIKEYALSEAWRIDK